MQVCKNKDHFLNHLNLLYYEYVILLLIIVQMISTNKPKVPSSLYQQLLNFDSNIEEKWILVVFASQKQYIIDIINHHQEDNTLPTIPVYLQSNHNQELISTKTIHINKDNKQNILDQYEQCHNDAVNEVLREWCILNIQFPKLNNIQYTLVGYNKGDQEYECSQLVKLVSEVQTKRKQLWSNYSMVYSRNTKQKKSQKDTHICLLPIINYNIQPSIAPINISKTQIREKCKPNIYHVRILLNSAAVNEEMCNRINLYLKEKVHNIENQNQYQQIPLQRLSFLSNSGYNTPNKIFNPHHYAPYERKDKYSLYLVKGLYQYYHYGDQGFSDNGWGCAYRAFQTLLSWMQFQGYAKPINKMYTVREIQQQIDMFDRSRKLKGTSEWIGATEISWLIPRMTTNQINCKIMHVSDGKQILQKCEQFRHHLESVGCPIMYGGGQYAYSIVGMHYNWKYGQCQFLILDPHYTGEDDYTKIIEKKGLAWRKPEQMFKKGIFYNFCLPLVYGK